MTVETSGSFELRVTNIYRNDKSYVAFSGVQIERGRKSSTKEIIVVNTKSSILATEPVIGQCWRVSGCFEKVRVNHGSYYVTEVRINPDRCECFLPENKEVIVRFLSETNCFKGIGESKARALVETFPTNLFQLIKSKEIDELMSGTGLTRKAAESLIESFKKYSNLEYAQWLSDKSVPMGIIQRIIKYHGSETIVQITNNPYRLLHFGLPFKTKRRGNLIITMGVDEIAQTQFGVDQEDPRRLSGAIDDAVVSITRDGHSCATEDEIIARLKRLIGNDKSLISTALEVGKQTASIKVTHGNLYHPLGLLIMESVIAKRLLSLREESSWSGKHDKVFRKVTTDIPFPLLQRQLEAVHGALEQGVYAITGGAGTGKTTVLRAIMTGYKQLSMYMRGIALSGRAAMRLSEATGFECCTIAKFLREKRIPEGTVGAVVIDEASMIDLKDMYRIIMHIPRTMRLLFVGDAEQLPPIGAGLVFHDIVKSGVIGKTVLDIVKRTADGSDIPQYSDCVRRGVMPDALSTKNITFHECLQYNVDETSIGILTTCDKNETQIITASNSKRHSINIQCQERLNSNGKRMLFSDNGHFQHVNIKERDPVIFTQNNYDAKVWNGTMGYLTQATSDEPDILGVVVDDSGADVAINLTLVDSLDLAYAITLHKAQGSQFKQIIIILSNSRQLDRSWLYTALTRATEHVHIVGTREMLDKAIKRLGTVGRRKTYLKKLLIQQGKIARFL